MGECRAAGMIATASVLILWSATICSAQTETFVPTDEEYVKLAYASGSNGDGAVSKFDLTISTRVDPSANTVYNWDNQLTWQGKTELILRVHWAQGLDEPWEDVELLLSTVACNDPALVEEVSIYLPRPGQRFLFALTDLGEEAEVLQQANRALHFYRDTILDIDEVKCVVFRKASTNAPLLSGTVLASPPSFPNVYHTGIQVAISDRGYAYNLYESYDRRCGAVVQDMFLSNKGHTRVLYDYTHKQIWTMTAPSPIFPKGSCRSAAMDSDSPTVHLDGLHLAPSAQFLTGNEFANATRLSRKAIADDLGTYPTVRGVPVEVYETTVFSGTPSGSDESIGIVFFLTVPSWHANTKQGQRMLQRIEVDGVIVPKTGLSYAIEHKYDYYDFKAFIPDTVSFEPCTMLPGGDGCDCLNLGCEADTVVNAAQAAMTINSLGNTEAFRADLSIGTEEDVCVSGSGGGISKKKSMLYIAIACVATVLVTVALVMGAICLVPPVKAWALR